ncbi:colicin E5-related ribonuclease [Arthrobacter sp. NPDC090010]|uniref:colicin E5-related ribonuclease n=1 Tax=Arthrobacter sp. NPDC090010 TaxID=3363942 RepID=UPI0038176630
MSLSYDSSRVDGLTAATNNQASPVGDGWALAGLGSIKQKFQSCKDQGNPDSYDLCGNKGGQSFSIAFGGRSGKIIKDASSGAFKLENDDNTRIEYLKASGQNGSFDGGYWKLTDTAGTQYFFGRNKLPGWANGSVTTNSVDTVPVGAADSTQPCAAASFGASLCQQAAAWNLDYVVDVNGNSQAVYYAQDTNYYSSQKGTGTHLQYIRSSRPTRIDYGMRSGSELGANAAPLQYVLSYTGRCAGTDCSKGSDIPPSYACSSSGSCEMQVPTFYSDQRLQSIATRTLIGSTYQDIDRWSLAHSFPDPGDGTKPALWLGSITHTAADVTAGRTAITDAPVVFSGQTLQNRVYVVDGQAPLDRYRLSGIKLATGGIVSASYLAAECTPTNLPASPETNTKRCFPQYWAPTEPFPEPARMDYFHIYPVAAIGVAAGPAGGVDMLTRYQYLGSPAWKYPEQKYVSAEGSSKMSWSVFAGYGQVKTTRGNNPSTANPSSTSTYLRGLDGTPSNTAGGIRSSVVTASDGTTITDSPWLTGMKVEEQAFLGDTTSRLSTTITAPWSSAPTATSTVALGSATARHIGVGSQSAIQTSGQAAAPIGGSRSRTISYTHDGFGRVTATSSTAQTGGADASCRLVTFADNVGTNLLAFTATETTRAGECANGSSAGAVLAATRTLYDSSASADPGSAGYTAPSKGLATRTDTATATSGSAITAWQQGPTLGYDALGRVTTSTDNTTGSARVSKTGYAPAIGLPTTVTGTNPLGWTSSQTLDASRGAVTANVDVNGNVATSEFDAAGRLVKQWSPLRPKASNATPDTAITYAVSQTAPSWIRTETVSSGGSTYRNFVVFDGLGRARQTQKPSPTGGTIATDTYYNSAGDVTKTVNDYYMTGAPSGTLMVPTVAVPSSTTYGYDAAGRVTTTSAVANDNQILWTTTTAYAGTDTVTTTGPTPPGGIASSSAKQAVTDLNGNAVINVLFRGPTTASTADTTSYGYDALGQMTSMKDVSGNTWTWGYDAAGRQVTASDPDSGNSSMSYDSSGRLSATSNALGSVSAVEYDDLDRTVKTTVTPNGGAAKTLTTRSYDSEKKGQLSSETRYNGANFDQAVTTSYSNYNANNQAGTTSTTLPSVLGTFAGAYTTTATYKQNGLPSTLAVPAVGGVAGETLTFGYDSQDRPGAVFSSLGDKIVTNGSYNNLGWLGSFQQWDKNAAFSTDPTVGVTSTSFDYDATTQRLMTVSSNNDVKGVIADLGKTTYKYDSSGKITNSNLSWSARTNKPVDNQCYAYDYADRLSAAWTPTAACGAAPTPSASSVVGLGGPAAYAQTFSYTTGGDRAQVKRFGPTGALSSTESYSYQGTTHRLTGLTSTLASGASTNYAFAWDAAGRMTGRAGQTLKYTEDGKLAGTVGTTALSANPNPNSSSGNPPATTATGDTQRFYTASGESVGIIDGTGTTVTIGATTAHVTTTGTVTGTRLYSFAGQIVAERTAKAGATQLTVVLSGRVNTAQTVVIPTTATAGTAAVVRFTDPYGLARGSTVSAIGNAAFATAAAGARGAGTNAANPAGFGAVNGYIGKLADTQSKLVQVGARELDSVLGVFTTPDPVLDKSNQRLFSPYMYSGADPINFSDPSGLFLCDVCNGYEARPKVGVNHMSKWETQNYGRLFEEAQPLRLVVAPGGPQNYGYSRAGIAYHPPYVAPAVAFVPSAEDAVKPFVHSANELLSWGQSLVCPGGGPTVCGVATGLSFLVNVWDKVNENPDDVGGAIASSAGEAVLGVFGSSGKAASKAIKYGKQAAESAGKAGAKSLLVRFEPKIEKQLKGRGWTKDSVRDLVNNPSKEIRTRDTRWRPDGSGKNDDPATAYLNKDGGYVVRNDKTADIVQVSDLTDPNWKSPW